MQWFANDNEGWPRQAWRYILSRRDRPGGGRSRHRTAL